MTMRRLQGLELLRNEGCPGRCEPGTTVITASHGSRIFPRVDATRVSPFRRVFQA